MREEKCFICDKAMTVLETVDGAFQHCCSDHGNVTQQVTLLKTQLEELKSELKWAKTESRLAWRDNAEMTDKCVRLRNALNAVMPIIDGTAISEHHVIDFHMLAKQVHDAVVDA